MAKPSKESLVGIERSRQKLAEKQAKNVGDGNKDAFAALLRRAVTDEADPSESSTSIRRLQPP